MAKFTSKEIKAVFKKSTKDEFTVFLTNYNADELQEFSDMVEDLYENQPQNFDDEKMEILRRRRIELGLLKDENPEEKEEENPEQENSPNEPTAENVASETTAETQKPEQTEPEPTIENKAEPRTEPEQTEPEQTEPEPTPEPEPTVQAQQLTSEDENDLIKAWYDHIKEVGWHEIPYEEQLAISNRDLLMLVKYAKIQKENARGAENYDSISSTYIDLYMQGIIRLEKSDYENNQFVELGSSGKEEDLLFLKDYIDTVFEIYPTGKNNDEYLAFVAAVNAKRVEKGLSTSLEDEFYKLDHANDQEPEPTVENKAEPRTEPEPTVQKPEQTEPENIEIEPHSEKRTGEELFNAAKGRNRIATVENMSTDELLDLHQYISTQRPKKRYDQLSKEEKSALQTLNAIDNLALNTLGKQLFVEPYTKLLELENGKNQLLLRDIFRDYRQKDQTYSSPAAEALQAINEQRRSHGFENLEYRWAYFNLPKNKRPENYQQFLFDKLYAETTDSAEHFQDMAATFGSRNLKDFAKNRDKYLESHKEDADAAQKSVWLQQHLRTATRPAPQVQQPKTQQEPEVQNVEPEPTVEPIPVVEPEPIPEPIPEIEPEPIPEPIPEIEPEPEEEDNDTNDGKDEIQNLLNIAGERIRAGQELDFSVEDTAKILTSTQFLEPEQINLEINAVRAHAVKLYAEPAADLVAKAVSTNEDDVNFVITFTGLISKDITDDMFEHFNNVVDAEIAKQQGPNAPSFDEKVSRMQPQPEPAVSQQPQQADDDVIDLQSLPPLDYGSTADNFVQEWQDDKNKALESLSRYTMFGLVVLKNGLENSTETDRETQKEISRAIDANFSNKFIKGSEYYKELFQWATSDNKDYELRYFNDFIKAFCPEEPYWIDAASDLDNLLRDAAKYRAEHGLPPLKFGHKINGVDYDSLQPQPEPAVSQQPQQTNDDGNVTPEKIGEATYSAYMNGAIKNIYELNIPSLVALKQYLDSGNAIGDNRQLLLDLSDRRYHMVTTPGGRKKIKDLATGENPQDNALFEDYMEAFYGNTATEETEQHALQSLMEEINDAMEAAGREKYPFELEVENVEPEPIPELIPEPEPIPEPIPEPEEQTVEISEEDKAAFAKLEDLAASAMTLESKQEGQDNLSDEQEALNARIERINDFFKNSEVQHEEEWRRAGTFFGIKVVDWYQSEDLKKNLFEMAQQKAMAEVLEEYEIDSEGTYIPKDKSGIIFENGMSKIIQDKVLNIMEDQVFELVNAQVQKQFSDELMHDLRKQYADSETPPTEEEFKQLLQDKIKQRADELKEITIISDTAGVYQRAWSQVKDFWEYVKLDADEEEDFISKAKDKRFTINDSVAFATVKAESDENAKDIAELKQKTAENSRNAAFLALLEQRNKREDKKLPKQIKQWMNAAYSAVKGFGVGYGAAGVSMIPGMHWVMPTYIAYNSVKAIRGLRKDYKKFRKLNDVNKSWDIKNMFEYAKKDPVRVITTCASPVLVALGFKEARISNAVAAGLSATISEWKKGNRGVAIVRGISTTAGALLGMNSLGAAENSNVSSEVYSQAQADVQDYVAQTELPDEIKESLNQNEELVEETEQTDETTQEDVAQEDVAQEDVAQEEEEEVTRQQDQTEQKSASNANQNDDDAAARRQAAQERAAEREAAAKQAAQERAEAEQEAAEIERVKASVKFEVPEIEKESDALGDAENSAAAGATGPKSVVLGDLSNASDEELANLREVIAPADEIAAEEVTKETAPVNDGTKETAPVNDEAKGDDAPKDDAPKNDAPKNDDVTRKVHQHYSERSSVTFGGDGADANTGYTPSTYADLGLPDPSTDGLQSMLIHGVDQQNNSVVAMHNNGYSGVDVDPTTKAVTSWTITYEDGKCTGLVHDANGGVRPMSGEEYMNHMLSARRLDLSGHSNWEALREDLQTKLDSAPKNFNIMSNNEDVLQEIMEEQDEAPLNDNATTAAVYDIDFPNKDGLSGSAVYQKNIDGYSLIQYQNGFSGVAIEDGKVINSWTIVVDGESKAHGIFHGPNGDREMTPADIKFNAGRAADLLLDNDNPHAEQARNLVSSATNAGIDAQNAETSNSPLPQNEADTNTITAPVIDGALLARCATDGLIGNAGQSFELGHATCTPFANGFHIISAVSDTANNIDNKVIYQSSIMLDENGHLHGVLHDLENNEDIIMDMHELKGNIYRLQCNINAVDPQSATLIEQLSNAVPLEGKAISNISSDIFEYKNGFAGQTSEWTDGDAFNNHLKITNTWYIAMQNDGIHGMVTDADGCHEMSDAELKSYMAKVEQGYAEDGKPMSELAQQMNDKLNPNAADMAANGNEAELKNNTGTGLFIMGRDIDLTTQQPVDYVVSQNDTGFSGRDTDANGNEVRSWIISLDENGLRHCTVTDADGTRDMSDSEFNKCMLRALDLRSADDGSHHIHELINKIYDAELVGNKLTADIPMSEILQDLQLHQAESTNLQYSENAVFLPAGADGKDGVLFVLEDDKAHCYETVNGVTKEADLARVLELEKGFLAEMHHITSGSIEADINNILAKCETQMAVATPENFAMYATSLAETENLHPQKAFVADDMSHATTVSGYSLMTVDKEGHMMYAKYDPMQEGSLWISDGTTRYAPQGPQAQQFFAENKELFIKAGLQNTDFAKAAYGADFAKETAADTNTNAATAANATGNDLDLSNLYLLTAIDHAQEDGLVGGETRIVKTGEYAGTIVTKADNGWQMLFTNGNRVVLQAEDGVLKGSFSNINDPDNVTMMKPHEVEQYSRAAADAYKNSQSEYQAAATKVSAGRFGGFGSRGNSNSMG